MSSPDSSPPDASPAAPPRPLVEVVGARAGYGPIEVLHDVSMSFPAGAIVALAGRNGSGKSSLLGAIAGIVPLRTGTIRLAGRNVTRTPPHRRAALGVTLVAEQRNVFASMTVEENLRLFADGGAPDPAFETFPELERLRDHRAATLSGGERQMLAVSRAVLHPSRVMMFDEVSSGLAPGVVSRLTSVIAGLRRADRCLIVVEQYLREVIAVADFVYVLRRGELAFAGEAAELMHLGDVASA